MLEKVDVVKQCLLPLSSSLLLRHIIMNELPPGQHLVSDERFPVLDLGYQPEIKVNDWKLEIVGLVDKPLSLSLNQLKKLGVKNYSQDFHCVTSWSKLQVKWKGIPFKKIIALAKPKKTWKHLVQYGMDDYSTNVRREDVEKDNVFLAFELDGKPISREHGYFRIIIPHLYGYKSAKFLNKIEFLENDKQGYWEKYGYHNKGRVSEEERLE